MRNLICYQRESAASERCGPALEEVKLCCRGRAPEPRAALHRYKSISLGQGQGPRAEALITEAHANGSPSGRRLGCEERLRFAFKREDGCADPQCWWRFGVLLRGVALPRALGRTRERSACWRLLHGVSASA